MEAEASLWPGVDTDSITTGTAPALPSVPEARRSAGELTPRAAAHCREATGEPIEAVSAFLDHSSLAVTSTYLRRVEGQHDLGWGAVASAIGTDLG